MSHAGLLIHKRFIAPCHTRCILSVASKTFWLGISRTVVEFRARRGTDVWTSFGHQLSWIGVCPSRLSRSRLHASRIRSVSLGVCDLSTCWKWGGSSSFAPEPWFSWLETCASYPRNRCFRLQLAESRALGF